MPGDGAGESPARSSGWAIFAAGAMSATETVGPAVGDKPLLGSRVLREQPEQFGPANPLEVKLARSRMVQPLQRRSIA